jgi:predicted phage terminase large subunit-like protein
MDRLAALSRAHQLVEELATRTAESSLRAYLVQAWAVLEPGTTFTPGWHLDAICDHGEAVLNGHIKNLIVNIAPRHSKPCDVDGLVLERTRGRIALRDVRVGDHLLTHRGRFRRVAAVHEQGILPVLAITTHTGRTLRVAADHPLLTPRGWVEAAHLTLADTLAEVHPQEPCGTATVTACEARLLGYLIGDGGVKGGGKRFTNQDRETLDDFQTCARGVGFIPVERPGYGRRMKHATTVSLTALQRRKGGTRKGWLGPVRTWLTTHGLDGKCSYDKRVPAALLGATPDLIAEFVGAYWACDGFVAKRDGRVSECHIGCTTVSKGLALDLQHLLSRLGIQARVRTMRAQLKTRAQGDVYTSYNVVVTSIDHGSKFAALVPVRHSKKRPLLARYTRSGFDRVLNEDRIVSIQASDTAACRCLTVDEDHSFAYQDCAVHNSTVISKALPTYAWIRQPELRFMYACYSASLSIEHAVHSRQVIESPWYQTRWGHIVQLTGDQNIKSHYQNTRRGYRIATSVGGTVTGRGADILVCDDPHNLEEIDSDVVRTRDKKWYREVWTTRLNDPKTGRKIVIAQRGHEDDLSADLIASGDYERLILPTEYVPTPYVSVRGWRDPRTTPGELLCPTRFGPDENARAKRELGDKYSAQHQQQPTPPGGKLFQREWFPIVDAVPADAQVVRRVRGWDAAATAGGGDWTVGVRLARTRDGLIYVEDVVRVQVGPGDDEALMLQTATLDGRSVEIIEEEEGGSSGKKVIAAHAKKLAGYSYKGERSTGDKVTRAKPFVAQARVGNVRLVRGPWNKSYVDELAGFPGAPFDDQVDATTKAYNDIALAPETKVKPRRLSGY